MVADHNGADPILDAIGSQVDGMVTGYVVIASFLDETGDSRIFSDALENQRCHQTLGLLSFAEAIEKRRAAKQWENS